MTSNGNRTHQQRNGHSSRSSESPEVTFYRANERPYGPFSNLYKRAIWFEGEEFPTAEHAYQAGKPRKQIVRDWILSAPTPAHVAMAAHGLYPWDIAPGWSKLKFDRMKRVLLAKFSQYDDLQHLLLSTGNARLVETPRTDTAVNRRWGEVNGRGQNMLGVLLMEVRDELRRSQDAPKQCQAEIDADQCATTSNQRALQPSRQG